MFDMMTRTSLTLHVAANRESLGEIRRFVCDTLTAWHVASRVIDQIRLAVDEAATNVIVHGYCEQDGALEIRLWRAPEALIIVIRDTAPPFDPTAVACPAPGTVSLDRPPGGLGLSLIRQTIDVLQYCIAADGANELTLIKSLAADAAGSTAA